MHFYVDLSLVCVIILSVCFIISKTAGLRKEKIKIVSENMGIFYTAGKLACFGTSYYVASTICQPFSQTRSSFSEGWSSLKYYSICCFCQIYLDFIFKILG